MKAGAYACVIGNPSAGKGARRGIKTDIHRVIEFLNAKGVRITNKDYTIGLSASEMRRVFTEFVSAIDESDEDRDAVAVFYFCGHALESQKLKDILLLGQDANSEDAAEHSLRLLEALKELAPRMRALKVIVIDGCRLAADGDDRAGLWESFEDVHSNFLRTISNLYIVTATSAGRPAFQGVFTNALLKRLHAASADSDELAMPLEGWLRNVLGRMAETNHIQRPSMYCYTRTREWTMRDLMKSAKERSMDSKDALEAAHKALDQKIEEVWSEENGIEFIAHAIYHNGWQNLQHTEFNAIQTTGDRQAEIISDDQVWIPIRNFLIEKAIEQFEEAKKKTKISEESSQSICRDIPAVFGPQISWRWRVEPGKSFVFLAGGVGPPAKQKQWSDYSEHQLNPDSGGLLPSLLEYSEAFANYNTHPSN